MNEAADHELLARAAHGDEAAFTALYRRRQGGVYRYALQMTGSPALAEDVTQDTFMTLVRELGSFNPQRGSVMSYLFGIARNFVLRRFAREAPYVNWDDESGPGLIAEDPSALETLLASEQLESVRRAVLALPPAYREAVVLCDLQELSYADAAAVLSCPVGTVRSRLNRGRAMLGEKLSTAAKRCSV